MASQSQSSTQPTPRRAHDPTQTTTYLLARTTYLTSLLTKSLLALTATSNPQHLNASTSAEHGEADEDEEPYHPPVETADACMQIDAQTGYMIRAAEELGVLTETMRGMWLLGGGGTHDTGGMVKATNGVADTDAGDTVSGEKSDGEEIDEMEDKVVRGMEAYLRERDLRSRGRVHKSEKGGADDIAREDVAMNIQDG